MCGRVCACIPVCACVCELGLGSFLLAFAREGCRVGCSMWTGVCENVQCMQASKETPTSSGGGKYMCVCVCCAVPARRFVCADE